MRYEFMQNYRKEFSIEKMAEILKVSARGYYAYIHKCPSKREHENKKILSLIKQIYKEGRCMYGSPRIHARLCQLGHFCSKKRIARLMRKVGIVAKMRKKNPSVQSFKTQ